MTVKISIAILTYNEGLNLEQALRSVSSITDDIVVLDSGSTDETISLATRHDCRLYYRDFDNFSNQRKFLLDEIEYKNEWVFVLDADEYLTEALVQEIEITLNNTSFDAFYIKRRFYWMGEWVRRGYYPTTLLRLGRVSKITCDDREINEHIICKTNNVGYLKSDFIDHNKKGLTDWIQKHNNYSSREADALFVVDDTSYVLFGQGQYSRKRWIRTNVWNNLPVVIRPFIYFFYRFFIRLGFLDGPKVAIYHFLHAFIYRVLIDFKYLEKKYALKKETNETNSTKHK